MKRFFSFLAAAAMLFTASCSNEDLGADEGEEAVVSFSMNLQGASSSKAIGDGTTVNKLVYSVYQIEKDENGVIDESKTQYLTTVDPEGQETFPYTTEIRLAKNKEYRIVFWAQNDECEAYTLDKETMNITVNYEGLNNDEKRDAFFAYKDLKITGSVKEDITLRRPFAQLNVGVTAEDWNAAVTSNATVERSKVTVKKVANSINLFNGVIGENTTDVTYEYSEIPTEMLMIDLDGDEQKEQFHYLSMSYLLAEKADVSVDFMFETESNEIDFSIPTVPVERNHRTNIIGQILTGNVTFEIKIDAEFDHEPGYMVIHVKTEEELIEALNVKCCGLYVHLTKDITLTKNWVPVGTEENPWIGVLDGHGHKISGLTIDGGYNFTAFFGYVGENTVIKDVTFEDVDIKSDKHAAAVVCDVMADGLVLENVTVSGNIEAPGYGAGIVCFTDGDVVTIRDCENNANVSAQRSAGIVAWIDTVDSTIENVTNNGNITGSISAAGIANRFAGTIENAVNNGTIVGNATEASAGVVGTLTGSATFEYCYNYGNVKTTANNANSSAAGILGQCPSTKSTVLLTYCANYGDITAEESYAAGIAYSLYGNINAHYCYNEGDVFGADGAGAIAPKAQYGANDTAKYCLNAGIITSRGKGKVYQGSNKNTSCYYYNNNELFNVSDNTAANADDALNVLNGGTDTSFFSVEGGIIVVK